jgi:hypothetical protein
LLYICELGLDFEHNIENPKPFLEPRHSYSFLPALGEPLTVLNELEFCKIYFSSTLLTSYDTFSSTEEKLSLDEPLLSIGTLHEVETIKHTYAPYTAVSIKPRFLLFFYF